MADNSFAYPHLCSLKFTLRNSAGVAVSTGLTPPLMITDDHKSSEKSTEAAAKAAAAAAAAVGLPAPQHISGSPAGSRAGSTSGSGPKVLIMPSNPPSSLGSGAKKGAGQATASAPASTSSRSSSSGNGHSIAANGAAKYRGSTAPLSSAASAYAASTAASTAPTSRTHTNGTVSPSFAALNSVTSSALATAVSTPLPAILPLPRGTKRAAARSNGESNSLSPNEDSSSSSTSSDATRHHQNRKQRTANASASTPYDRRSSPAGSSLSGASSVLGTPHFPTFGMSTALPQMEDADDGSFDFTLDGGLDRRAGSRLPTFSADSPPSASAIGLAGLTTGDNALLCDPNSGEMRIELGSIDDMLFSMEARPHDSLQKTRSPTLGLAGSDGCDTSDAYHRSGGSFYRPTFVRTGSDADMTFDTVSTADNDGDVEAMSFDSLVDYEGGSSCATGSAFSPPASGSTSSRRETSASSGTSSDSDSLLGGTGLAPMSGPHSHWPSIYPSALNNPNNIQISYPQHSYVVPTPPAPPPLPRPSISRLIPAEGPLAGGIEITLLGVNFLQGMVAFFGENRASMTSCWNDGTIVCTVPPGVVAGSVPVILRMEGRSIEGASGAGGQLFTYKDASDRALCVRSYLNLGPAHLVADPTHSHLSLELALQVVGLKMTGRIEDAKNVALRILGQGSFATNVPTSSAANTASGSGNIAALDPAPAPPSEKTTLQRIQSTYESAAISMTGRSKYQIPPLAVSQDDKQPLATAETTTTMQVVPQTKEKSPSWAAATAAQARRLTEREIARYGHHSARKSAKGGKYDKMCVLAMRCLPPVSSLLTPYPYLPSRAGSGSSGCRSSSASPSSSPSRTCRRSSATSSASAAATCRSRDS